MVLRKSGVIITVAALFGILFAAGSLYAGAGVRDEIPMDNPAYDRHKRSIVIFTHKKHVETYAAENPDLFKDGCGACHHDENFEPLTNLKEDDEVQSCIECHSIPANLTKPKDGEPGRSKEERLEYHAYAVHHSCQPCHRAYNKASGTKDAPTSCTACHPKTKED
jgi:hypothetical protein